MVAIRQVITRATLGRLPLYLQYLKSPDANVEYISATKIANALKLGEVQVRKDLSSVSSGGKPKVGYIRERLIDDINVALGCDQTGNAVIVGAGKLGNALLDFDGFADFGLKIVAAFDTDPTKQGRSDANNPILPMEQLKPFCNERNIHIGIITVPLNAAQSVCDDMIKAGISAIWNFAPITLNVPEGVIVSQENLALSLAHLKSLSNH